MTELIYPLSAALLLYFVVIPALTLGARGLLRRWGKTDDGIQGWGSAWVWTLIVAPSLLPLLWWTFDAFHQISGHHTLEACLTPHADGGCAESFIFAILVLMPAIIHLIRTRIHLPKGTRWVAIDERVKDLRVFLVDDSSDPISTRGFFNPWIGLRADALEILGREELVMALLHEGEHIRGLDPLRRWLAGLALALNPTAALLRPYFSKWELGREATCDLQAATKGDRFALAHALVRVARLNLMPPSHVANLVGRPTSLTLRVSILVHDVLPELRHSSHVVSFAILAANAMAIQLLVHFGMHELHLWSEHAFSMIFN
jgi:hypothetical protein